MAGAAGSGERSFSRRSLGAGARAKVYLADEDLRIMGRIDLLTVDSEQIVITGYRTGTEDEARIGQLQLYGLLWDLDRVANPQRRPLSEMRLAYVGRDICVPGPAPSSLRTLEESVRERIGAANAATADNPPTPRPSVGLCRRCDVRGLCYVYWVSVAPDPATVDDADWSTTRELSGRRTAFAVVDASHRNTPAS